MTTSIERAGSFDGTKSLVGFQVGAVRYAIDLHRVREIIKPLPVLPLPLAAPEIIGVADHRGDVVPVIDLRRRFGMASAEYVQRSARWILVKSEPHYVGLLVDAVIEVFGPEEGQPQAGGAAPHLGVGDAERAITAVHKHDGGLVFVLDVDRVADVARQLDVTGLGAMIEAGETRQVQE